MIGSTTFPITVSVGSSKNGSTTAVLQSGVAQYGVVTVVYLLVSFLLVAGRVRGELPWSLALALGFGLGLDYVFRHLLVADLP